MLRKVAVWIDDRVHLRSYLLRPPGIMFPQAQVVGSTFLVAVLYFALSSRL